MGIIIKSSLFVRFGSFATQFSLTASRLSKRLRRLYAMNERTGERSEKIIGNAKNEYTVKICMRSLQINNLPFCVVVFTRSAFGLTLAPILNFTLFRLCHATVCYAMHVCVPVWYIAAFHMLQRNNSNGLFLCHAFFASHHRRKKTVCARHTVVSYNF